jgi:hypothetical protein
MGLVQVRVFYSWPHLHIYLLLWSSSLPLRENKAKSHLPPSAWVHRKRAHIGIHKKHEAYALVTLPELHKLYTSPALLHILPRHWPRGQYRLARNAPLLSLLRSRDSNVPIPVPPTAPNYTCISAHVLLVHRRRPPPSPPSLLRPPAPPKTGSTSPTPPQTKRPKKRGKKKKKRWARPMSAAAHGHATSVSATSRGTSLRSILRSARAGGVGAVTLSRPGISQPST